MNAYLLILMLSVNYSTNDLGVTFKIEEAGLSFELPEGWSLSGKTGRLDYGKVQYSFTHEHVEGDDMLVNPAVFITLDKGGWFSDEEQYIAEKMLFHQTLDNVIDKNYEPGEKDNPLGSRGYFAEGTSGITNNPFGQKILLGIFWNDKFGFHMEINTSVKEFEQRGEDYKQIFKSISPVD